MENPSCSLSARLEKISEALIFSEPSDIQALSKIHSMLTEFAENAGKESLGGVRELAEESAGLVEKIVLGEVPGIQDAWDTLVKTVSKIQSDIQGGPVRPPPRPPATPAPAAAPAEKDSGGETGKKSAAHGKRQKAGKEKKYSQSFAGAISSDPELVADFISEAGEHLDNCNHHLLDIERNPGNLDALNAVFRAFHTIKGVSSFLNLSEIRELAHQAENLLDKARSGERVMNGTAIDLIFESVDTMKQMIDDLREAVSTGSPMSSAMNLEALIERLQQSIKPGSGGAARQPSSAEPPQPPGTKIADAAPEPPESAPDKDSEEEDAPDMSEMPQFLDELGEHLEILDGTLLNMDQDTPQAGALDALFRSFHTVKGSAGFIGLRSAEKIAHSAESLLVKARSGEQPLTGKYLDSIFDTIDGLKKISEKMRGALGGAPAVPPPPIAPLSSEDRKAPKTGMAAVPAQTAPAAPAAAPPKIQEERGKNGPEPAPPPATRQPDAGKKVALKETVKVDADRLDKLLDTIGELVIAESMVTQSGELRAGISAGLAKNLSLLDKITRELQSMGTSLRMVPVASTFQKMARLARDLSKKIDKEIEFVTRGDETELDKTVVDKIGDPLVHMVRNAIDHGIEKSREERARAGKPPKGRVELRAFHKGGCIFIEIEDDGRGLDKNAIRRKALEKGLIGQADNLTDKEIYALIFAPGFSTAEKITEISGRGVGMDVARKNIDSMRGQIDIQSELGRGSVFSIKLPLTLAIIDGMVVNVRGELYIIPTLSIVMSVKISKNELKTVQKRGVMLPIQGELIPVFSLDQILSRAPEAAPDTALETRDDLLIVVVEDDNKKTGVIVDRLEGQHQIVIKPLGDYLHGVSGLAGGAIMPDGTVGLIIDVGGIVRLAGSRAAPAES